MTAREMESTSSDVACILRSLQDKCMVVDGLMLNPENEVIIRSVLFEIKVTYEELMLKCANLSDEDVLSGCSTTKSEIKLAKSEFDERVKIWLDSESVLNARKTPKSSKGSNHYSVVDRWPRKSSSSSSIRSSRTGMSSKHKEGLVKFRMAVVAADVEAHRCRMAEQDSKLKEEIEQREQEVLHEALRIREEAEQRVKEAKREAERKKELLNREVAQRERMYEAQMAAAEVKAWEEASNYGVGDDTSIPRVVAPSVLSGLDKSLASEPKPRAQPSIVCDVSATAVTDTKPAVVWTDRLTAPRQIACTSSDAIASAPIPTPWQYPSATGLNTINNGISSTTLPMGPLAVGSGTNLPYHYRPYSVVDYPPPRPEIPKFAGDPLCYWTFIRSFDIHIANKMPNDEARLVCLLQHCAPDVRRELEHFVRDGNAGYRLARESLYNTYGQPHVVAYCCEQKLLSSARLKERDPSGLKSMAIQMEKCLAMLKDIGEFATLNSFGTIIQRLTDKFPQEMKRDWVKWSFNVLKQTGKQAKFSELVEFVRNESDEANSLYGKALYTAAATTRPPIKSSVKRTSAFGTSTSSNSKQKTIPDTGKKEQCFYCQKRHRLERCEDFQRLGRYKRIEFLRKNKLCFWCLDQGHMLNQCETKEECKVSGCSDKRHHTLLHKHTSASTSEALNPMDPESVPCGATAATRKCEQTPYFMTVPVKVCYQNNTTMTYALLDTGSQRTFCDQSLASKLGAKGPETLLPIQTLSSGIESKMVCGSLVSSQYTPYMETMNLI